MNTDIEAALYEKPNITELINDTKRSFYEEEAIRG